MTISGGIKINNCQKELSCVLILQDDGDLKRGDAAGLGLFTCPKEPKDYSQVDSNWQSQPTRLERRVTTKFDINNPKEGIDIRCKEIECKFNV